MQFIYSRTTSFQTVGGFTVSAHRESSLQRATRF